MAGSDFGVFFKCVNRVFMAVVTCTVAIGGAGVGIITGAIQGLTTETGLARGAVVGAVTGAIAALQLMDMMTSGEPFSKVSLICSLLNGDNFTEWVSPAVLKAYQWQISGVETSFVEIIDGIENNGSKGLCPDSIKKLPNFIFKNCCKKKDCSICLRSFKNREEGRELLNCRHIFHLKCIDEWLIRNGSCPICRRAV